MENKKVYVYINGNDVHTWLLQKTEDLSVGKFAGEIIAEFVNDGLEPDLISCHLPRINDTNSVYDYSTPETFWNFAGRYKMISLMSNEDRNIGIGVIRELNSLTPNECFRLAKILVPDIHGFVIVPLGKEKGVIMISKDNNTVLMIFFNDKKLFKYYIAQEETEIPVKNIKAAMDYLGSLDINTNI